MVAGELLIRIFNRFECGYYKELFSAFAMFTFLAKLFPQFNCLHLDRVVLQGG